MDKEQIISEIESELNEIKQNLHCLSLEFNDRRISAIIKENVKACEVHFKKIDTRIRRLKK